MPGMENLKAWPGQQPGFFFALAYPEFLIYDRPATVPKWQGRERETAMQKLSSADRKRRDDYAQRIRVSAAALSTGLDEVTAAIQKFNGSIDAHNELLNEVRGWRDDLVNEIDEFIAGKTEKWLDGDKGSALTNWKEEIENLEIDDLDRIEEPDELEAESAAETIEQMSEEAA